MAHQIVRSLLIAALALPVALTGCEQSASPPGIADKMAALCEAIKGTGLTKQCSFNDPGKQVGIVIDTSDEAARNLCADIANKMLPLTNGLPSQWKLQIFSPYRDDKPLVSCALVNG